MWLFIDPNTVSKGDSGGPLSRIVDGKYVQIGIVSYGSDRGCTYGDPLGFTKIHSLRAWIKEVTGLSNFPVPPPPTNV